MGLGAALTGLSSFAQEPIWDCLKDWQMSMMTAAAASACMQHYRYAYICQGQKGLTHHGQVANYRQVVSRLLRRLVVPRHSRVQLEALDDLEQLVEVEVSDRLAGRHRQEVGLGHATYRTRCRGRIVVHA